MGGRRERVREWTKRRRVESEMWRALNTQKGLRLVRVVKLHRLLAEDIRELRSHSLSYARLVLGHPMLTPQEFDHFLAEQETVYNKCDAVIQKAVDQMVRDGVRKIPKVLTDRYLSVPAAGEEK